MWTDDVVTLSLPEGESLPKGRSRYNCTARDSETGRYYWFSHAWLLSSKE
jgi:hypothetical protein